VTGQLGTITRSNGSLQLAYKDLPLYFLHNDAKPGDTFGTTPAGVSSGRSPRRAVSANRDLWLTTVERASTWSACATCRRLRCGSRLGA
jgi:hypothetical protein